MSNVELSTILTVSFMKKKKLICEFLMVIIMAKLERENDQQNWEFFAAFLQLGVEDIYMSFAFKMPHDLHVYECLISNDWYREIYKPLIIIFMMVAFVS